MSDAGPLRPVGDATSQFFWDGCQQDQLLIQQCNNCGIYTHWPRPMCRHCLSFDLSPKQVSGRGTVYTFTICRQSFHPWFHDKLPYVLAVIELVEQPGLRLVSNIIDIPVDDVRVGMEVEVHFDHIDDDLTLPMFRPRMDLSPASALDAEKDAA